VAVNIFLTSTIMVLNHFVKGSQIQIYNFVRERTKQLNWHILFYCTNEVCYTKY